MHKNKPTGKPAQKSAQKSALARPAGKPPRRHGAKPAPAPAKTGSGDRIAKVIARAGLCSRREAEAWIAQGRVAVNGKTLQSPALAVGPGDEIAVDGRPLAQRQRTRLFLFHKPRGLVTTTKDPEGRPTVFDYLHDHAPEAPRLMSVGRLDINTEGLLLLTNDGGLARVLELPATGWLRRYRVRAKGETNQAALNQLAKGVTIDGIRYAPIEATLDRQQGANCWLTMALREGKNREIKRVLDHMGLAVNRLIRLSFGPFQLGELAEGKLEEVRTRVLRDQLGPSLAAAAGVDFDAPLGLEAEERPRREEKTPRTQRAGAPARSGPRPKRARPEPEPEKIKHRPQPGPRKHISALRAEERTGEGTPRRRIETAAIADRKGRNVTIERHVEAKKPLRMKAPKKPAAGRDERPPQRGSARKPQQNGRGKGRRAP